MVLQMYRSLQPLKYSSGLKLLPSALQYERALTTGIALEMKGWKNCSSRMNVHKAEGCRWPGLQHDWRSRRWGTCNVFQPKLNHPLFKSRSGSYKKIGFWRRKDGLRFVRTEGWTILRISRKRNTHLAANITQTSLIDLETLWRGCYWKRRWWTRYVLYRCFKSAGLAKKKRQLVCS